MTSEFRMKLRIYVCINLKLYEFITGIFTGLLIKKLLSGRQIWS